MKRSDFYSYEAPPSYLSKWDSQTGVCPPLWTHKDLLSSWARVVLKRSCSTSCHTFSSLNPICPRNSVVFCCLSFPTCFYLNHSSPSPAFQRKVYSSPLPARIWPGVKSRGRREALKTYSPGGSTERKTEHERHIFFHHSLGDRLLQGTEWQCLAYLPSAQFSFYLIFKMKSDF